MKITAKFLAFSLLTMIGAGATFAQSFTGDPASDGSLWVSDGLSSSALYSMQNANNSASFSANVYSTAFSLNTGSTLLGSLGTSDGWAAGDTIVGVGGVFASSGNSSLTYDNANSTVNLHLVVKYGSPNATWNIAGNGPPVPPAGGAGSLTYGGIGAVLLGVMQETVSSSSGLVTPSDSPTYVNSADAQVTLPGSGIEGQVLTFWSGSAIVGFESFMDLNVLQTQEPAANVALGDAFVLDLQQGQSSFQDSLYTLPSALQPVPEPSTLSLLGTVVLLLGGARGLQIFRRHSSAR